MNCLFCDIASKKIPAHIVYEDEKIMGFLDIKPLAPGHTVIIPKTHAESILDLNDELITPVFGAVKKMTGTLKKVFGPEGFTIGINQGKTAGVDHLHIHIIPRWENDGGGSIHTVVLNPPEESLESIKEKILEAG
jgi:histidine triad (HIT) family protein